MTQQCRVCFHRSKTTCPGCGGVEGYPTLGLGPCKACPNGLRIGNEVPQIDMTAFGAMNFYGMDSAPSPVTLEAIATSNMQRRARIDIVLQARPEMLSAIEQLLAIEGLGTES